MFQIFTKVRKQSSAESSGLPSLRHEGPGVPVCSEQDQNQQPREQKAATGKGACSPSSDTRAGPCAGKTSRHNI